MEILEAKKGRMQVELSAEEVYLITEILGNWTVGFCKPKTVTDIAMASKMAVQFSEMFSDIQE